MFELKKGQRLFVLTGAGTSAESGLRTFRGEGGVWRERRAEDIAHINAWRRDPRFVWEFYSMRRRKHEEVAPNPAHYAIAEMEKHLGDDFFLCTQNVDRLHEMAGSQRITHIHGKIFESKCDTYPRAPFEDMSLYENGEPLPRCVCGGTIRPNVCWFGEATFETEHVLDMLDGCDAFMAVGTSGVVEPVASFVAHLKMRREPAEGCKISTLYVGLEEPRNAAFFDEVRLGKAAEILPEVADQFRFKVG